MGGSFLQVNKTVAGFISPGETKEEGKVRSKLLTLIAIIYINVWNGIRMGHIRRWGVPFRTNMKWR